MDPDSYSSILNIIISFILIGINGFFVAAEFSIVKIRKSQIESKNKGKQSTSLTHLNYIVNHLDEFLSATQFGITLASIGLGWIAEESVNRLLLQAFSSISLSAATIRTISVIISFSLITSLHIILGELVPKSMAIRKVETISKIVATPLYYFYWIFKPFIWSMNFVSELFLRMMKIQPLRGSDSPDTEELKVLLKQSADIGDLEEENYEIIRNVFEFNDHTVKQILLPRHKIVAVDLEDDVHEILTTILNCRHSRVPAYKGTLDNVVGILYTKEVLKEYILKKMNLEDFDFEPLIHKALFIVESKNLDDVLKQFQEKKQLIAIVIDEFGGTEGIITLEDILEELVGEIHDEEDIEQKSVVQLDKNTYRLLAKDSLQDINESLPSEIPMDPSSYNTLAGYILNELDDIPVENQEFDLGDYHFKIEKMENRSVYSTILTYKGLESVEKEEK